MDLSNCELLLGKIEDINDPKQEGRVLVTIMSKNENVAKNDKRWILPFGSSGHDSFSTPTKGASVWVLYDNSNPAASLYMPKTELEATSTTLISNVTTEGKPNKYADSKKYEHADVIFSRDIQGTHVNLYYNDEEGINMGMKNSDMKNNINIDKQQINIRNGDNGILLNGLNGILIGNTSSSSQYEYAVMGKKLQNILTQMGNILKDINVNSTNDICAKLREVGATINKDVNDILSDTVKISK